MANPDELCGVCDVPRAEHGDARHEFSLEGELKPLGPAKVAAKRPPRTQDEATQAKLVAELTRDQTAQALLRLVDVLVDKELLSAKDLIYVLGGSHAPRGRSAEAEASRDREADQSE